MTTTARRARRWSEVRGQAVADGRLTDEGLARARADTDAAVAAYALAQVRKEHLLTQAEVAAVMQVGQSRVSQIERGDLSATQIGTLAAYIEALGGQLRIEAVFGDTRTRIA